MANPFLVAAKAIRVADFLLSLGVNTHLEYTDGTYADTARVIADLTYLGIHTLRDRAPNPRGGIPYRNYLTALDAVAGSGNRFDFITGPALPLATTLAQIDAVAAAHPDAVVAVEGPNEINNEPVAYAGRTGPAAAQAFQRALFAAVHADRALTAAAVYDFTGGPRVTDLGGRADAANAHPYPSGGQQPGARIAQEFAADYRLAGDDPRVITETGYYDTPRNPYGGGVDPRIQARHTLNLVLDAFAAGVSRTFLYQLLTAYPDDGTNTDAEYGLFRLDNTAKPVAVALHNLTTILADYGPLAASFTTGRLTCTVSGLPPGGGALLMQKSDGVFALALWAEPPDWDEGAHAPLSVAASSVTVGFATEPHFVAVFEPLLASTPRQTRNAVDRLRVAIAAAPVIVEIGPPAAPSDR